MSEKAAGRKAKTAAASAGAGKNAAKSAVGEKTAGDNATDDHSAGRKAGSEPPAVAAKVSAAARSDGGTVRGSVTDRSDTNADAPRAGSGGADADDTDAGAARTRLTVRKTYKLYIGGAFPRSESGRSYEVTSARGAFLANAALASRKDARDAVRAARSAFGGWSGATAYNRGQILYRVAEMLEGRREQFAHEVAAVDGVARESALAQTDAAIDRWVWYAGWSDKISQVRGTVNPVAGPFWSVSSPEPTGVVAVFAPERPSLFGLVSVLAPVIVSGNCAVVVAPDSAALPAITLAEVLATSDLPGGVVNILTGRVVELGGPLASHLDVDGLDLSGVAEPQLATDLERAGAQNLKRVRRPVPEPDWAADPGLDRIVSFLETKTVWHPVGV